MDVKISVVLKGAAVTAAFSGSEVAAPGVAALRRVSCPSVNASSCSLNHHKGINGTMSAYSLNAYGGPPNCLIEHCSAGKVFTAPKDFGLEGHGSLLIFDDSKDQDRFEQLMVRIFEKLKCLLDNAGPKEKAPDNSDLPWYLCKENEPQFLDQTQSEFHEKIGNWKVNGGSTELLRNIVTKLQDFDANVNQGDFVEKCTDKFHSEDFDFFDDTDSGCPFPGHFWDVRSFLPNLIITILNNYLVSIGSEPVQPTNGTNATVDGIGGLVIGDSTGEISSAEPNFDLVNGILLAIGLGSALLSTKCFSKYRRTPLPTSDTISSDDRPFFNDNESFVEKHLKDLIASLSAPSYIKSRELILTNVFNSLYYLCLMAQFGYDFSRSMNSDDGDKVEFEKLIQDFGLPTLIGLMMGGVVSFCCFSWGINKFKKCMTNEITNDVQRVLDSRDPNSVCQHFKRSCTGNLDLKNSLQYLQFNRGVVISIKHKDKYKELLSRLKRFFDCDTLTFTQRASAKQKFDHFKKQSDRISEKLNLVPNPGEFQDKIDDIKIFENLSDDLGFILENREYSIQEMLSVLLKNRDIVFDFFQVVTKGMSLFSNFVIDSTYIRMLLFFSAVVSDGSSSRFPIGKSEHEVNKALILAILDILRFPKNENAQLPQQESLSGSDQASDAASNEPHSVQEPIPEPASLVSDAASGAPQSVQGRQSPAASGQDNDAASGAPQSVQEGQDNDAASNASQSGQVVPARAVLDSQGDNPALFELDNNAAAGVGSLDARGSAPHGLASPRSEGASRGDIEMAFFGEDAQTVTAV